MREERRQWSLRKPSLALSYLWMNMLVIKLRKMVRTCLGGKILVDFPTGGALLTLFYNDNDNDGEKTCPEVCL